MKNVVFRIGSLTLASSIGVSYYYRPIGDNEACEISGPKRTGIFMSKESLNDRATTPPPLLYSLASMIVIVATTTVTRIFIYCGGNLRVETDNNYTNFVSHVRLRALGVPLITVSNHRSMLDDPAMMSSILPFWMSVQPKFIRWSVCSQEFCFNPAYSSLIHTFSGLGKVMPIKRGAGINQKLLLDFARRIAAGDWCHVFPEGGIWQRPELGGRENGTEGDLGKLKWGVGKLIAHSPKRAIVIPFFQFGMETTMPQHPVTKKLDSIIPRPGHDVTVRFGEEIDFDDLIEEHEAIHGALWKYTASVDDDVPRFKGADKNCSKERDREGKEGDFHEHWDSRPEELMLYHKIALRIEESLDRLNKR